MPEPLPAAGEAPSRWPGVGDAGPTCVRYAAATGDCEPDPLGPRVPPERPGCPGVVAHGLLLAAWFFQAAARFTARARSPAERPVRFRRPLRPAVAAAVTGRVAVEDAAGAELELALPEGGEAPLATARVRVTP